MTKRLVAAAVFSGLCTPVYADFLGVFTLESIPLSNCTVADVGPIYSYSRYGFGKTGGDKGLGNLENMGNNATNIFSDLGASAEELGYNAVLGARLSISHSMDAVYETGQNWRSGGDSFDFDGGYMVVAYGTPVILDCS